MQSHRHACADYTDGEAEAAQAILKEEREKQQNRDVSRKDDEFADLIARIGPAKAPWQRLFEDAKSGVNKEDADSRGNALPDEGKRHSLLEKTIHTAASLRFAVNSEKSLHLTFISLIEPNFFE